MSTPILRPAVTPMNSAHWAIMWLMAWFTFSTAALAFPTAEPPSITVNVGEEVCVLIHPPDDVTGPKSIIKGLAEGSGIKRRQFQLSSFGL